MTDLNNSTPKPTKNIPHPHPDKVPIEPSGTGFSGGVKYPNPPDNRNPDPATLREQWKFAIKQYSKWYSHAWGTAILAGLSFFALGWIIKGSNPLPSFKGENPQKIDDKNSASASSSTVPEGAKQGQKEKDSEQG